MPSSSNQSRITSAQLSHIQHNILLVTTKLQSQGYNIDPGEADTGNEEDWTDRMKKRIARNIVFTESYFSKTTARESWQHVVARHNRYALTLRERTPFENQFPTLMTSSYDGADAEKTRVSLYKLWEASVSRLDLLPATRSK